MRHLPNFITILNLCCGCAAIVAIFNAEIPMAGILMLAAMVFDFLDGAVARILKAYSELGKQLDSLADMVSFGLAPGLLLYTLFLKGGTLADMPAPVAAAGPWYMFSVTLFSALRLARFNIDTRQSTYFIGLPTPANSMLILSVALIAENDDLGLSSLVSHPYFLLSLSTVSSWLLVAGIPLISLKFKSSDLKENLAPLLLLIVSLILFILFRFAAAPLIILLYVILSLLFPPHK